MTESNERVSNNDKVLTTEELGRYFSERFGISAVSEKNSKTSKKSSSKSVVVPVEVPSKKEEKEGISKKTAEKPKKTRRKSTSDSSKKATRVTGKSTKKTSEGKSNNKTSKADFDNNPVDDIYLDASTGLYYDSATGIALKDLYTDEEKKKYCDKKYGKGNWRKMSYEEFRRKFKMDMEIRAIAKSLSSDDFEEEF